MSQIFEIIQTRGLEKINDYLLYTDPEINVKDSEGRTPLMIALAYRRSKAILNRILDMNPEINVKDNWRYTPLMFALVYCKCKEILNRIIELGLTQGMSYKLLLEQAEEDEHKKYIKNYIENKKIKTIQRNLKNYLWRLKCKDLSKGIMVRRMLRELEN